MLYALVSDLHANPVAWNAVLADLARRGETIERAAVFSDGFLGYQYNKAGNYYFTTTDPWQRNFGFNILYDMGAPFVNFYYDTIRCKFRYENKDWLIQFWKGQYGLVFYGCEVGVYTRRQSSKEPGVFMISSAVGEM